MILENFKCYNGLPETILWKTQVNVHFYERFLNTNGQNVYKTQMITDTPIQT